MNELTPNLLGALKLLTPRQRKSLTTDQLFEFALHGIQLTKGERKRLDFNDWNTLYWAGIEPCEEELKRFALMKDVIRMVRWLANTDKLPKLFAASMRRHNYAYYTSPDFMKRFPSIKMNPPPNPPAHQR